LHDNRRDINPHDPDLRESDLLFALPTFLVLMSEVTGCGRNEDPPATLKGSAE